MDAEAYRQSLAALLPWGLPWPREAGSVLQRLLGAWGLELGRVDGRSADLVSETDPRSCDELLDAWELAWGLPDGCERSRRGVTLDLRRAALVARVTAQGGQSPGYFVALAERLGHQAEITEYRPQTVDADVDAALYDDPWASAWTLTLTDVAIYPLTVSGRCDEPLAQWDENEAAECLLARLKPAHTTLIIGYGA